MNNSINSNFHEIEAVEKLNVLLELNKWWSVNIWVKGSREFLNRVLSCFNKEVFSIMEYDISDVWNFLPVPKEIWQCWYISVVNSTNDLQFNHTINKTSKCSSSDELWISENKNSVVISWSENPKSMPWAGTHFDEFYSEIHD